MAPWRSVGAIFLGVAGINAQEDADSTTYYPGNAVPKRNMPPTEGCTVTGKIFKPLTPVPETMEHPFVTRVGWDWCQNSCARAQVTDLYGSSYPCQHFAFFPDGKCYLGGKNAVLEDADNCNATNPCEHGFQVISGPPSCANKSNWVFPPVATAAGSAATTAAPTEAAPTTVVAETVAPTTAAPTTVAPETVAPTAAAPETTAPETAAPETDAATAAAATAAAATATAAATAIAAPTAESAAKTLAKGADCQTGGTPCEDGLICLGGEVVGVAGVCTESGPKDVAVVAPVVVDPTVVTMAPTVTMTSPTTVTMTMVATTTAPPPPANSTIVGYYYEPHNMDGTARITTPNWDMCYQLCKSNVFCEHFGYWPDGGCHQQGSNVTLVKASEKCQNTTDCPGLEVISGPRDLSDEKLWPSVDLAKLGAAGAAAAAAASAAAAAVPAPAPPVTTIDDKTEPVVSSSGPNDVQLRKGEESSGGGSGWLVGLLVVLGLAGAAYAAYSMGLFGDGYDKYDDDDDNDEDPEDGEGSPYGGGSPQE